MIFRKHPNLDTPMDQFIHRQLLSRDERAVLDVYLTGVCHALDGLNTVLHSNNKDLLFAPPAQQALDAALLEIIVDEFLKQRPDMKTQPLGLCAVMAVLQRFNV